MATNWQATPERKSVMPAPRFGFGRNPAVRGPSSPAFPAGLFPCAVNLADDLRGSPLCVVTVAIGSPAQGLESITIPLMREYARRCGVDFRIIRDIGECQHPKFAVMQIGRMFDQYERILYLDADVLVRPSAPNLFDACPAGRFYARNEAEWQARSWCVGFQAEMNRRLGASLDYDGIHFNGGVQLADRAHRALYEMPPYDVTARENLWFSQRFVKNQPWFNHRRLDLGIEFAPLDYQWNCLMGEANRHGAEAPATAHFLHFATEAKHKARRALQFLEGVEIDPRRVCLVTVCVGDEARACSCAWPRCWRRRTRPH